MLKAMKSQAGDTIIEVLFAITIFSLVAVGGLSIMNQGITTSQRALEITLVRQEIDAQSEALRFLNNSYIAAYEANGTYTSSEPEGQWALMQASIKATGSYTVTDLKNVTVCPTPANGSFVINTRTAQFVPPSAGKLLPADSYAKLNYNDESDSNSSVSSANGIWIEAVRSEDSLDNDQRNSGFIDFHIIACWDAPGQSIPVTIGTIVRLYEPR